MPPGRVVQVPQPCVQPAQQPIVNNSQQARGVDQVRRMVQSTDAHCATGQLDLYSQQLQNAIVTAYRNLGGWEVIFDKDCNTSSATANSIATEQAKSVDSEDVCVVRALRCVSVTIATPKPYPSSSAGNWSIAHGLANELVLLIYIPGCSSKPRDVLVLCIDCRTIGT